MSDTATPTAPVPPNPTDPAPKGSAQYDTGGPRRRRRTVRVVVAVAVAVVLLGLGLYLVVAAGSHTTPPPSAFKVDVHELAWYDQSHYQLGTSPGMEMIAGDPVIESLVVGYPGCLFGCNPSETVSMGSVVGIGDNGSSAAWTYTGTNMPLVIQGGGSVMVSVTIQAPDANFVGDVSITLDLS